MPLREMDVVYWMDVECELYVGNSGFGWMIRLR